MGKLRYSPAELMQSGRSKPAEAPLKSSIENSILLDTIESAPHKHENRSASKQQINLTSETEVIFQLGRMLNDDYPSLSAYIADVMKQFKDARRCTIYLGAEKSINGEKRRILEHYLTVIQDDHGEFRTRAVDENISIIDGRNRALIAFREKKPTVLDFKPRVRIVFRNLDRSDKHYDTFRLRPERTQGMKAYIPFVYRKGSPLGIAVFEGDLGLKGCDHNGLKCMEFAAVAGTFAGGQIAFQLVHKFDALTKLKRKADFNIEMEEAIKKLQKGKLKSAYVLFIDLDDFKAVNTNYGHLKGDEVLSKVAERITSSIRLNPEGNNEDLSRGADIGFRFGGEEIAVILAGDISTTAALACAKRINANVAALSIPISEDSSETISVTCSISAVDVSKALEGELHKSAKRCSDIVVKMCSKLNQMAKERGKNCTFITEVVDGMLVPVKYTNGH